MTMDRTPPEAGDPRRQKSPQTLAIEAIQRAVSLFSKELDLVRAQAEEAARNASAGLGLLVGAVVIALAALNVLAAALVVGIANLGLAPGWAALIVGIVLAIVAIVLALRGAQDLKQVRLAPERVGRNLEADVDTIKEGFRG